MMNVPGMFIAVFLPMPLVALDPHFSNVQIACAFLVPGLFGVVSKDVLEPLLIGKSTALQPVALMLAIMIWGSVHPAHPRTPPHTPAHTRTHPHTPACTP